MKISKKSLILLLSTLFVIGISYFLVLPLFIDNVVDEPMPEFNSSIEIDKQMSGSFKDADSFHKTSGEAVIIMQENKSYLILENFKATNGPDLYVYLSTDLEATDFVELGKLKGNVGNQNYELNENIDVSKYTYVLIWCKAFSVLFGSAELS